MTNPPGFASQVLHLVLPFPQARCLAAGNAIWGIPFTSPSLAPHTLNCSYSNLKSGLSKRAGKGGAGTAVVSSDTAGPGLCGLTSALPRWTSRVREFPALHRNLAKSCPSYGLSLFRERVSFLQNDQKLQEAQEESRLFLLKLFLPPRPGLSPPSSLWLCPGAWSWGVPGALSPELKALCPIRLCVRLGSLMLYWALPRLPKCPKR